MKQRTLGLTGLSVSEVGLGCEHLQGMPYEQVFEVVDEALQQGINIFDVFMSEPEVRANIGRALAGRRDQVVLQGHIGAIWENGQYSRTRDRARAQAAFEDFLARLQTNYVDVGMIHFVDEMDDWTATLEELMPYAQELKASGVIRAIGMSSHNPAVSLHAVKSGLIDVLMFSVNPAYDLLPEDAPIDSLFDEKSYADDQPLMGMNPVRAQLYRACQQMGVGITTMKTLGAGALMNAQRTPFREPMSVCQLIGYALDRPGVCSTLIGCTSRQQVREAVAYAAASPEARDYSALLGASRGYTLTGKCMYCNHCLPCPSRIDIAAVNKYLDLAQENAPDTVRAHYAALGAHAGDCIECGQCEARCPFKVHVIQRMAEAQRAFGC